MIANSENMILRGQLDWKIELRILNTRIMVYKKHREILHMPVSIFVTKSAYDCCLFVA